jgi:hypothetical protein
MAAMPHAALASHFTALLRGKKASSKIDMDGRHGGRWDNASRIAAWPAILQRYHAVKWQAQKSTWMSIFEPGGVAGVR